MRQILLNLLQQASYEPWVRTGCATLKALGWQEEKDPENIVVSDDGLSVAVRSEVLTKAIEKWLEANPE